MRREKRKASIEVLRNYTLLLFLYNLLNDRRNFALSRYEPNLTSETYSKLRPHYYRRIYLSPFSSITPSKT